MQLKQDTTLQNGKYRIVRVLGQGGFGITYLAEHTMLDKYVAIKEFFPKEYCDREETTSHITIGTLNNKETVEKLKGRFIKEAKNIVKLDHPGIIKIHDIFQENDTAYYVMDYIEGDNLNEIVKKTGPLPESKAIEYIVKIGEALEYIHSKNMTHFDVKPANILVNSKDDEPILIDFGLSKQYDKDGSATSTMMHGVSQGYSPIELYTIDEKITFSPQSDIYSLGATLYFLITGIVPPNVSEILGQGIEIPASVDNNISDFIKKSMKISKTERPENILSILSLINPINEEYLNNSYNRTTSFNLNNSKSLCHPQIGGKDYISKNEDTYIIPKNNNSKIIQSTQKIPPAFKTPKKDIRIFVPNNSSLNNINLDEMPRVLKIDQAVSADKIEDLENESSKDNLKGGNRINKYGITGFILSILTWLLSFIGIGFIFLPFALIYCFIGIRNNNKALPIIGLIFSIIYIIAAITIIILTAIIGVPVLTNLM